MDVGRTLEEVHCEADTVVDGHADVDRLGLILFRPSCQVSIRAEVAGGKGEPKATETGVVDRSEVERHTVHTDVGDGFANPPGAAADVEPVGHATCVREADGEVICRERVARYDDFGPGFTGDGAIDGFGHLTHVDGDDAEAEDADSPDVFCDGG